MSFGLSSVKRPTHPKIVRWSQKVVCETIITIEEIPTASAEDYWNLIQVARMHMCQVCFMINGEEYRVKNETLNDVFLVALLNQHRIFAEALIYAGVRPEEIEVDPSRLDTTQQDDQGNTLLHDAVRLKCSKVAKTLVDEGASIHVVNHEYETPIDLALVRGHPSLYWLMIDPEHVPTGSQYTKVTDYFIATHREQLIKACREKDIFQQIYYAQKLAYAHVYGALDSENDHHLAARYLSAALFLVESNRLNPHYSMQLFHAFDQLERLYLLHIYKRRKLPTASATHAKHRETLAKIRTEMRRQLARKEDVYAVQTEMCCGLRQLIRDLVNEVMDDLGKKMKGDFGIMLVGQSAKGEIGPYSLFQCVLVNWHNDITKYQNFLSFLALKSILLGGTPLQVKIGGGMLNVISLSPKGFRLVEPGFGRDNCSFPFREEIPRLTNYHRITNLFTHPKMNRLLIHTRHLAGNTVGLKSYKKCVAPFFKGKKGSFTTPWRKRACLQLQFSIEEYPIHLDFDRISSRMFDNQKDILGIVHATIDNLALYFRIVGKTKRACIESLVRRGILSEKGGRNLLFVLEQATLWQLETQLFYKADKAKMFIGVPKEGGEKIFTLDESGRKTLLRVYQIIYGLYPCALRFSEGDTKAFATDPICDPLLGTKPGESEILAVRMAALSPGDSQVLLEKCFKDLATGKEQSAYQGIRQIIREFKIHPSLPILRCLCARLHTLGDVTKEFIKGKASEEIEWYTKLGVVYRALGETSTAFDHFDRALLKLQEEYRDQGFHVNIRLQESLIYTEKGWLLQDLEQSEEAYHMHAKAWDSVKGIEGDEVALIKLLLQTCLAYACVCSERTHKAKQLADAANEVVAGEKIKPSLLYAYSILNMGMAYALFEKEKGLSLIRKAIVMSRTKCRGALHCIAPFYIAQARTYHLLGEVSKTRKVCNGFLRKFSHGVPLYRAQISEIQGRISIAEDNPTEAYRLFDNAYFIYQSIYGKDHPITRQVEALSIKMFEEVTSPELSSSDLEFDSSSDSGSDDELHRDAESVVYVSSADTLSTGISPREGENAGASSSSSSSSSVEHSPEELFQEAYAAYLLNDTSKAFQLLDQISTGFPREHPIHHKVTLFLDGIGATVSEN